MKNNKIAIIDYGVGNLRSVSKAIDSLGAEAIVTDQGSEIKNASKVILPGVGAFGHCKQNLIEKNLYNVVLDQIQSGKWFLGICVGFQLLFEESTEFDGGPGFGIFPGKVIEFDFGSDLSLKVPHMGWNSLKIKENSKLFSGFEDQNPYVYFVHSYYPNVSSEDFVSSTCQYGSVNFCSSVEKDNILGCQFHPEKSQKNGLKILNNFLKL